MNIISANRSPNYRCRTSTGWKTIIIKQNVLKEGCLRRRRRPSHVSYLWGEVCHSVWFMCCSRLVMSRSFYPPSPSCRRDSRCAVCTRQELQIWLARIDVNHTASTSSTYTRCLCLWRDWKWSPPVESVQRRNCDCCSVCFVNYGSIHGKPFFFSLSFN